MRSNLFKIRKSKGLTVHEIATKLDISDSFYYKIEQGIRNPTINLAKKISDLLGENIEDLFFEENLDGSSNIGKAFVRYFDRWINFPSWRLLCGLNFIP